jgi:tetratricopeptide (TPR) repeat protein
MSPAPALVILLFTVITNFEPLEIAAAPEGGESDSEAFLDPVPSPWSGPLVLQGRALLGVRPQVVGEILAGDEGGELALAALAVPVPGPSEKAAVSLFIEIDGASFLDSNQADLARVEVYAYALGPNQRIADFVAEAFAVDVTRLGERVWQSGLEFFGRLELPPGSYTLRVLVRNFQSGARGLEILSLEIPDSSSPRTVALTPLFPEPEARDGWLPVCSWDPAVRLSTETYPFVVSGRALNPAARPVLIAGSAAMLHFPVSHLPAGEITGTLQLLRYKGGRQEIVAESKGRVIRGEDTREGDLEILTLRYTAPEKPPGAYWARVTLKTTGNPPFSSPATEVLLVSGDTRDRDLLWSDLRGLLAPTRQVEEVLAAEEPKKNRRLKRKEGRRLHQVLSRDYRRILATLGTEPNETTRGRLFEFESRALGGSVSGGVERLHSAELSVAVELGRRRVESVAALAWLHDQIYPRYRGRRLFSLLFHTRSLIEELADLYVELGGEPETSGQILASLAGYLQAGNLAASSRRLFARALEYDSQSAVALLGSAASHEKYGEYHQAIVHLEQLRKVDPLFDEGVLRLAINLDRVGMNRRARELLEEIVGRGMPGWVTAVAYQALARSYLETGAVERADELLQKAVEEMPERQGLRVLLAHVDARLGRTASSLGRLQAFGPGPRSARSERLMYDSWPADLLAQSRKALGEVAEEAAGLLSSELAPTTTDGR